MHPSIDLTENRDFGNNSILAPQLPDIRISDFVNGDLTTPDEYKVFTRNIEIFGNKYHINQKYDIFCNDTLPYESNQCMRCGKIMSPWNMTYGLCKECDKEVSKPTLRIPWRDDPVPNNFPIRVNPALDIFNLK